MRKLLIGAAALALVAALAPIASTRTSELRLVRVAVSSRAEANYLLTHFDETHNHRPGEVELLLWPGDAQRLSALGHEFEIVVNDVVARDAALARASGGLVKLPGPDRKDYRLWRNYQAEAKKLSRNDDLVKLFELAHPTLEGRRVVGLEIANNVRSDKGRPVLYVDGVHHAREWPAGEYPMIFAHYLVERFGKDPKVTELLKNVRVIIVPVVNPDGFDYSRASPVQNSTLGAVGVEGYWRKNRRSLTGLTVPSAQKNPDAYGVDVNRNYSWHWGDDAGGSSGLHADQTYRGDGPFSEPEARNVQELLLAENVTALVSNHTYSRLVIRPWGDTSEDAPDERIMAPLGARMARAMGGYRNIKGIQLYATTGTASDYAYGALGSLGYTFEHGVAFHPPYADSIGKEWRGVMKAFMIAARAAAKPAWHSVIRGRILSETGNGLEARLFLTKTMQTPMWPGNPSGSDTYGEAVEIETFTRRDGRFEWHVNPSTRPHAAAEGGVESYVLRVSPDGDPNCEAARVRVKVKRGRVVNVGRIVADRNGIVCTTMIEEDGGVR